MCDQNREFLLDTLEIFLKFCLWAWHVMCFNDKQYWRIEGKSCEILPYKH